MQKPGIVIFLNGTASAGKTSLSNELKRLDSSYELLSIDVFMRKEIFSKMNQIGSNRSDIRPYSWWDNLLVLLPLLPEEERSSYFNNLLKVYYQSIKTLALSGKNVIVDMVLEDVFDCFEIIKDLNALFVLVYCPFTQLPSRVINRNNSGVQEEQGTLAAAARHFLVLYKKQNKSDTSTIDQLNPVDAQKVLALVEQEGYWPSDKTEYFVNLFIKRFDLAQNKKICIAPRLKYDLQVNTNKNSYQKCAQQILEYIKNGQPFEALKKNSELYDEKSFL